MRTTAIHKTHPGLTWHSERQRTAEFEAATSILAECAVGTTIQAHCLLSYKNPITNQEKTITLSYRFFIDDKKNVYAKATPPSNSPVNDEAFSGFLGQGAYGKVFLAQNKEGELFAIKEIDLTSEEAKSSMDTIEKEFELAEQAGVAASEYKSGSLLVIIQRYLGVSIRMSKQDDKLDLAEKMCAKIFDLHKKGIAHNDARLDNFTIDDSRKVHLIDFGLSTRLLSSDSDDTKNDSAKLLLSFAEMNIYIYQVSPQFTPLI